MRVTVNFNKSAAQVLGNRPLVQFALKRNQPVPTLGVRPCTWVSEFSVALRLYPKTKSGGAVTCISEGLRERLRLGEVLRRGRYSLHFVGEGWYVLRPAPERVRPDEPLVFLSENHG